MQTIKFSTNWNGKLDNKAFTSLRVHDPHKYKRERLFNVQVGDQFYTNARIVEIRTMKLQEVTEFDARLDSGFSRRAFIKLIKKIYKDRVLLYDTQLFDLILFERLDSQTSLNIQQ